MALSVDWATRIITVPQADLAFVGGTLYALDTDAFRLELKSIEADVIGIHFPDTHRHVTTTTIAGTTYARFVEMINTFQVRFEDGQYAVRLDGSNNNIFDEGVIVRNQVSVISTNSAGLVVVTSPASIESPPEAHISGSYDGTDLTLLVWLTRNGEAVTSGLTTATVRWYSPDGTELFNQTDTIFDARGIASMTQTVALTASTAYYATISITDGTGTVIDTRGVPTGA